MLIFRFRLLLVVCIIINGTTGGGRVAAAIGAATTMVIIVCVGHAHNMEPFYTYIVTLIFTYQHVNLVTKMKLLYSHIHCSRSVCTTELKNVYTSAG